MAAILKDQNELSATEVGLILGTSSTTVRDISTSFNREDKDGTRAMYKERGVGLLEGHIKVGDAESKGQAQHFFWYDDVISWFAAHTIHKAGRFGRPRRRTHSIGYDQAAALVEKRRLEAGVKLDREEYGQRRYKAGTTLAANRKALVEPEPAPEPEAEPTAEVESAAAPIVREVDANGGMRTYYIQLDVDRNLPHELEGSDIVIQARTGGQTFWGKLVEIA